MSWSDKEKNTMKDNGWKKSAYDDNTYKRGNDTVKKDGNWTSFNNNTTSNHNITNNLLDKKTK